MVLVELLILLLIFYRFGSVSEEIWNLQIEESSMCVSVL